MNYNAGIVGIQNDHHFGNFAIPQTVSQQLSEVSRVSRIKI